MRASKAVLLVTYIQYCGGFTSLGWRIKPGHRKLVNNCPWSSFVTGVTPADVLETDTGVGEEDGEKIISITSKAMEHLADLVKKKGTGGDLMLRMGVKPGGCSGLSYDMDLVEGPSNVSAEDTVEIFEHEDGTIVKCIIDPKSLLYLFGMRLDYSDELVGGGFQFHNPNSATSCGCGKSFGV